MMKPATKILLIPPYELTFVNKLYETVALKFMITSCRDGLKQICHFLWALIRHSH